MMESILDEIIQSRVKELESQKDAMPLSSLKSSVEPSDRDFHASLVQPSPGFILECKKASPSQGLIRDDFDLVSIAKTYGRYASAISVLTESEYFRGSMANLGIVRQNAPQPLLCKDFVVDPYQVFQARHFGADAILLILAILNDQQWQDLFQLAMSLKMDVLTEVSNESERDRALQLGAPIIGINNRNLRDMSVDLATTRTLSASIPGETLVVSESGYYRNGESRSMTDCAGAFLIGSSLMGQKNLGFGVKMMIYGDNKVCGLTRNQDAIAADLAGASYGGVIFAESSPRRIELEDARGIFDQTDLGRVGVFQDHSAQYIVDAVGVAGLDVIQLHGDERPEMISRLRNSINSDVQIWKALSVNQLNTFREVWLQAGAAKLVVDNRRGDQRGGTGETFDWSMLSPEGRQAIILAGGIGPDNVASAMKLGCAGVDTNSGVEEGPGLKSASKIKAVFDTIRQY